MSHPGVHHTAIGKGKIYERDTFWEVGQNKLCKSNQILYKYARWNGERHMYSKREKEVRAGTINCRYNKSAMKIIATKEDLKNDNNGRVKNYLR